MFVLEAIWPASWVFALVSAWLVTIVFPEVTDWMPVWVFVQGAASIYIHGDLSEECS